MKTGNKNQAAVLAVVAVAALAFLVYRLVPQKVSIAADYGRTATDTPAPAPTSDLPLTLVGNPFSHPKLAVKPAVTIIQAPESDIYKGGPVDPFAGGWPSPSVVRDGKGPEDSAGKDRQEDQGPTVLVTAIMQVGKPVAILQINGKDPKTFSAGDLLAPDSRLVSVDDDRVTVRVSGKEHVIHVGETFGDREEKKQ